MKRFWYRHQPPMPVKSALKAGTGAALALAALGALTYLTSAPWLIAPFGASCVLLFAAPSAVLSQPANLIGGHVVAAITALLLVTVLPGHFWMAALAAGLAISAMVLLRVVHPPAGATALVAYLTAPGWSFLLVPVLAGGALLVVMAWAWFRLTGGGYPLDAPP